MNKYMTKEEFFKIAKPGDYFISEFTYDGDNGEKEPGFCKGIIKEIVYGWSDEDNGYGYQDVILCSKLITVDGIEPEDGDFYVGGASDIRYRFMFENEIIEFENMYKQN